MTDRYRLRLDSPRREIVVEQRRDQLARAFWPGRFGDAIRAFRQRRHGVSDCHAAGTVREKVMVVFGVPDRNDVVRGHVQLVECGEQATSFAHTRRDDHDGLAVEDDLVTKAELRDRLERGNLVGPPGEHDCSSRIDRDAALSESLDQGGGWRVGESSFGAIVRAIQQGPVLGNHPVEQLEMRTDGTERRKVSPGHQHDTPPRGPNASEVPGRLVIDFALPRDGPVVVAREHRESHASDLPARTKVHPWPHDALELRARVTGWIRSWVVWPW